MNPDTENFEQLRKLLALKRHEQPPPGYFNNFSAKIIARIEAGENAEPAGWAQKFWAFIEAKPMLTGAFGAAMCALAISGFVMTEDQPNQVVTSPVAGRLSTPFGASVQPVAMNATQPTLFASTNQVSPELRALLNGEPSSAAMPAAFGFPGR